MEHETVLTILFNQELLSELKIRLVEENMGAEEFIRYEAEKAAVKFLKKQEKKHSKDNSLWTL